MGSLLLGKEIAYNLISNQSAFPLIDIAPRYLYEQGKKTDTIVGQTLVVGDIVNYTQLRVSIPLDMLIIDRVDLLSARAKNQKIYVSFDDLKIKAYNNFKSGSVEDQLTASNAYIVDSLEVDSLESE